MQLLELDLMGGIARAEGDDAVDCVNLGMGNLCTPIARIVCMCVSVFLISSTMFILEHIWAFGGDTE